MGRGSGGGGRAGAGGGGVRTGKPRDYAATVGGKRLNTRQFMRKVIAGQKEISNAQRGFRRTQRAWQRLEKARDKLANARWFDTLRKPPGSRGEVYDAAAKILDKIDKKGARFLAF